MCVCMLVYNTYMCESTQMLMLGVFLFIFEARSLTVSPKDLPISAPPPTSGITDVLWCRFNVDCRVPNLGLEA